MSEHATRYSSGDGDADSMVAAAANLLRFAAAPIFAVMAVVTGIGDSDTVGTLCMTSGRFGIGGMMPMYLLMCLFHIAPWLRLMSGRKALRRAQ